MSFYKLIANNKKYLDEINIQDFRSDILRNPKLKSTNICDICIDYFDIEHDSSESDEDTIYGTRITIFSINDSDTWPPEKFDFCYFPFYFNGTKYYLLVKDITTFVQNDIESFSLNIDNYYNIFTVVKNTKEYPNITDIIIKNYLVHKKIRQNKEPFSIVSTIMKNMKNLILDSFTEKKENFLKSHSFNNYRNEMILLLKQIIESDKLKYGVDYVLNIFEASKLINLDSTKIPEYCIPENFEYPSVKIGNPETKHIIFDEYKTEYHIESEPTQYGLTNPIFLPSKEWSKFYGGITVYEKDVKTGEKFTINNESKLPSNVLEYLDSIPVEEYKKVKKLAPYKRSYNPSKDVFNYTSSTNFMSPKNSSSPRNARRRTYELPVIIYSF